MDSSRSLESITASAALQLVLAAKAKAEELGVPMSIWVVDQAGAPKAMLQMDGVPLVSTHLSRKKAVTSASVKVPTEMLSNMVKDAPAEMAAITQVGLVVLKGGHPVVVDGHVVGAIGVGGGMGEQDDECAKAALASLS